MADRTAYRQPQVGNQGFSRTVKTLGGPYAVLTTDLALNRTTALLVAPKGFVCTDVYLSITDVDSNGTPTVVLALGDAADDDRFITGATIGQAGGASTTLAAAGLYYEFTADTEIALKATTASATAVAGTGNCYMTGFMK